jgi:RHS repeat-associated protein
LTESPLVVPGVQALDGGQQVKAQERASLVTPSAVAARELSRTQYAHLNGAQAARLALVAFPGSIGQVVDPGPRLRAGQSVLGYPSDNTARVDLGGGKRAVVESTVPIAAVGSSGRRVPVDLALSDVGAGFAPAAAAVAVGIPRHARNGVQLSELGVSLTPVDSEGSPLGGAEGVIDGASVLYPNTGTASDTAVKPVALGFDEQTLLRSAESPQQLYFRVGLPEGGRLAQDRSGAVRVMDNGEMLARIASPSAQDAAGADVPVSMKVSGDMLSLTVDHRGGAYQYPVAVDPTVVDSYVSGNWRAAHEGEHVYTYEYSGQGWEGQFTPGHVTNEWAAYLYPAQGESRIYELTTETAASDTGSNVTNSQGIYNSSGWEVQEFLPATYTTTSKTLCVEAGCPSSAGKRENVAEYLQNATGKGNEGYGWVYATSVYVAQNNGPSVAFDTTDPTLLGGYRNVLASGGSWLGSNASKGGGMWVAKASDSGTGASTWLFSSPSSSGWKISDFNWCEGVMCPEKAEEYGEYAQVGDGVGNGKTPLPDGEDKMEVKATDSVGLSATATATVKIDGTAPHAIKVSGLPANHEIGNSQYHLTLSATDGTSPTPSSGMGSLAMSVNGKEIGKASGSCSPGPCAASRELTISGSEFAVGPNTVIETATDNAGNSSKEELTIFVARPTAPVGTGPGSVNPQSGEMNLSATDASIASPGSPLTLSRSYGSLHLEAGSEGALGPQWSLGLGGAQNLTKLSNGNVLLTDGTGLQAVFASKGGGEFTAPKGDENLKIKEVTNKEGKTTEFVMAAGSGAVTKFTLPGGTGSVWAPTTEESVGGLGVTTTTYQTVKGILEPTQVLAPVPGGVSCAVKLARGCRALGFVYASNTTAKGDNQSEWGDYENHLREATFTAYDPSKGQVKTTTVAQYQYDKEGRLRAEWNPLISPALKTTYGYDATGHVTSVTPAGQQPWTITYGAIAGDTRTGRVLAVTRPSSSTEAGAGEIPTNTEAPKLSTTKPVEGTELKVTSGAWSNSPLSYSYQWERCSSAGTECTPILGATNPGYTPLYKDEEHALVAQVTATNGTGSITIATTTSAAVPVSIFPPTYSLQIGKGGSGTGQLKAPTYVARDGSIYVSDTGNNRVEAFNGHTGEYNSTFGTTGEGNGQFKEPTGITVDESGNIYVADSGNKRIEVFNPEGKYQSKVITSATPTGLAINGDTLYVIEGGTLIDEYEVYFGTYRKLSTFGNAGENQLKNAKGIAYYNKKLYVSNTKLNHINRYNVESNEGKYETRLGVESGPGNGEFKEPTGISVDPAGNLWVVDTGNSRVQEITTEGKYITQFGSVGTKEGQFTKPLGIIVPTANEPFVVDSADNRIEKFIPGKRPTDPPVAPAVPPKTGTSAVSTIEYNVPVSGEGAPYAMGSTEVATWGQEDDPVEATAYYPPDQPMGWPAQQYKRASIYYLDGPGHTVNTAQPGGSIMTREYNSINDVTRTLGATARQTALNEGKKSAEASRLLDTQNTYNKEGDLLEKTLGPQHTVKLKDGEEVLARRHTQYFYDESAPKEGGPYGLPTKMTVGAEVPGGKDEDVRTTTTSYSGQSNLGWKLRQPTSVIADPSGLDLIHKTGYDPVTGNVTEATMPAGAEETALPVFNLKFGSFGNKEGQFEAPWGAAVDQKGGNVYVSDYLGGRVEKFTSGGFFAATIGSKGSGEGQVKGPEAIAVSSAGNVYVGDTGNHRVEEFSASGKYLGSFGKAGTGEGQFSSTIGGLVVDSGGNTWVSDTNDERVEEFNSQGKYIRGLGEEGGEEGQFYGPMGMTISGGNLYVADLDNNRIQEFNLEGKYIGQFGGYGEENGQLKEPWAITSDANGDLYVSDRGPDLVEEFSSTGKFVAWIGTYGSGEGQFNDPEGIATSAGGNLYVVDLGNHRIDEWIPGNQGAHTTKTLYYTATSNAEHPSCGNHGEWANLACETLPASQPETPNLPQLATATYTYNLWDEPEKTTETVKSTIRTKTATYDTAGRLLTAITSSSVGIALPIITNKYDTKTGALTVQSTTSEGKTLDVEGVYNTLGQLTSYIDADGNTTNYTYDVDGRTETINDGKGTQTYTYDATTGALTSLKDTAAEAFTLAATYNSDGSILTESYPNGMKANYTYNPTGQATGLEYVKTTHCPGKCTWFKETIVTSINGQILNQISNLATKNYTYDNAGRLTQVQSTPAGKTNCTTRIYANDPDSNRTSLSTREPGSEGKCTTGGGINETHSYDTADRLTDTGVSYDTWGNTLTLPASDAGGTELTSSYYTDNQLASQTQNGQTISYQLDPTGRIRETISTGKTISTATAHYSGPSQSPAWTTNTAGEWTRMITGIDGHLAAVQSNSEAPVLQLTNLHGDIIATAYLSETAGGLASSIDTTEYGVPTTNLPPKYSWLGALQLPTELPSGVIAMGARSYVPQIGRFLQDDPIPGGSANAYAYTFGDPVNTSDPTGAYVPTPAWTYTFNHESALAATVRAEEEARRAAEEAAARAAAEQAAWQAEQNAATAGWLSGGEEEFWEEEWEEEEWGEEEGEYVAWQHTAKPENNETHVEEGVLYQPIQEGRSENSEGGSHIPVLGGCPSIHAPCYPHGHHTYHPEHGSGCRSGGSRDSHGHCQPGHGNVPNDCAGVGGAVGGAIGSIAGGYGSLVGGAIGGAIGGAVCGNSKT